MRAAVWSTPVIAVAAAAPAFAASTGPLSINATKAGGRVTITFTGGRAGLLVTIISVSYTTIIDNNPTPVTMNPTTGISSVGGTSLGGTGSANQLFSRTYTVSYSWAGGTYTATDAI